MLRVGWPATRAAEIPAAPRRGLRPVVLARRGEPSGPEVHWATAYGLSPTVLDDMSADLEKTGRDMLDALVR